jgi:hypothetical protein
MLEVVPVVLTERLLAVLWIGFIRVDLLLQSNLYGPLFDSRTAMLPSLSLL